MKNLKYIVSDRLPRKWTLVAKYMYQAFFRLLKNKERCISNYPIIRISKKKYNIFFGYYDIKPFNEKTDEIIYLQQNDKIPQVDIVIKNLNGSVGSEKVLAKTNAWNWQQGCRLRWMPNNSREIVFNDYGKRGYFARIVNVDTAAEKLVNAPLYDITTNGEKGLSLNFERLGVMRPGYGYTCKPYVINTDELHKEGIDLVDINNNIIERIVTYDNILQMDSFNTCSINNCYINHISFSPSGDRFLFFWIEIISERHKASLIVYDMRTKKLVTLENKDSVSHYVWLDNDNIICTAYDEKHNCKYYRYDVSNKQKIPLNFLPNRDGHPSIYGDGLIITDTYPDLMGYQHLYMCGQNNEINEIMSIYSTCLMEGERRTDLHPRVCYNKKVICFDANIKKYRDLYILYLK